MGSGGEVEVTGWVERAVVRNKHASLLTRLGPANFTMQQPIMVD